MKRKQTLINSYFPRTSYLSNSLSIDLWLEIANLLSSRDVLQLLSTSQSNFQFFRPHFDPKLELSLVVEGNVTGLKKLIERNPEAFFLHSEIITPRGKKIKNISPCKAVRFFCDEFMEAEILQLIPEKFKTKYWEQCRELDSGGADLVKVNFDPLLKTQKEGLNCLREFKKTYVLPEGPKELTFFLLENPDGIFYWKDEDDIEHLYYVNCTKNIIIEVEPKLASPEDKDGFAELKEIFSDMECNSSRRTNNNEHHFIKKTMGFELQRNGIDYEWFGKEFKDNCTPFYLVNALRKCHRLYEEAQDNNDRAKAKDFWNSQVGYFQGEVLWLFQRLCEESPFSPCPEQFKNFERRHNNKIFNIITERDESFFLNGKFSKDLGSLCAIYKNNATKMQKGMRTGWGAWAGFQPGTLELLAGELAAINQLVNSAKRNRVKPEQIQDLQVESTTLKTNDISP
ncbi:MAG: hypothetical protein H0U73_14215 [Tatlockia sp.]|nr:hypothetical protein [Tatlockia sp.]